MKPALFLVVVLFSFFSAQAQLEYSNWPVAQGRLSFTGSPDPKIITDVPPGSYYEKYGYILGRSVSYSDPVTGQVLATLADGQFLNRFYDTLAGSGGIALTNCGFDSYRINLLPRPGNPHQVYAITQFSGVGVAVAQETGLQTRCNVSQWIGLYATLVDLDANGGKGQVLKSEYRLPYHGSDGLCFIKHQNGTDYWIVAAGGVNGGNHKSYLVNKDSISLKPIVSYQGPPRVGGTASNSMRNFMHASSDGKTFVQTNGLANTRLEIYGFDNMAGITTNYSALELNEFIQGAVISHDNSKLYVATYIQVNCGTLFKLYQFDLKSPNIAATKYLLAQRGTDEFVPMQRTIDGNIFLGPTWHGYNRYFDCIRFPNQPKAASVFTDSYMYMGDNVGNDYYPYMPANPVNDVTFQAAEPQAIDFGFADTTSLCAQAAILTAPAGYGEYRWNTGATTRAISVSRPGIYSVVAGDAGFKRPKAFGDTYVKAGGLPIGLGRDTTACPQQPIQLTVPWSFTNVLWSDGDTSHTKMVMPPGGKTVVSALDVNGCRSWDSICVGFKYYPRADFGPDTVLCDKQTLKLKLEYDAFTSSVATIKWSTGASQPTINVTSPGTYWGTITQNGCMNSDTIRVSFVSGNAVKLGNDTTICNGATLTLRTGEPGIPHLWSDGSTADTLLVSAPGQYWVKAFSSACTAGDTINVGFINPPAPPFGTTASFCEGSSLKLGQDATPGAYSFLWNTGATTPTLTVQNAGAYWRQTNDQNGCTRRDTILVSTLPAPLFSLGPDTLLCYNKVVTLRPLPVQNNITWRDGSKQPTYQVNKAGTYWATAMAANGCTYTDTVQVQYEAALEIKLPGDTTVCANTPVQLNVVSNTNSLRWSTGATGATHVTASQPGWYWAEVGKGACALRDSILISWKPNPPGNLLGADTTVCEGTLVKLDATTAGATYNWNVQQANATVNAARAGAYWVDVNLNGCITRSSIVIQHILKPRPDIGNDTLLCNGQTLQLVAPATATDYRWQNGSTAPVFIASQPGVYSITVTNSCGSTTDEIKVDMGACYVQMPNAFTPNNDGLNDVFRVKYPEFIKTFSMLIFDRWGNKVFQTTDARNGWNGNSNGLTQPSGNYIWNISYTDIEGKTESLKGWVVLIR